MQDVSCVEFLHTPSVLQARGGVLSRGLSIELLRATLFRQPHQHCSRLLVGREKGFDRQFR